MLRTLGKTIRTATPALTRATITRTSRIPIPSPAFVPFPPLRQTSRQASTTAGASSTLDPQQVAAQDALDQGTAALEIGDLDAAKDKYEESLKIKDTAVAHYNLGVVLYQLQDLPGAILHFEASISLTPPPPPPPATDPKSTSTSATTTLPTDPTTLAAHLILADTHTNLGAAYILSKPPRPDLALSHLQSALELNPDDGETVYNLAAVLEALGEDHLDESLVAYNRALALGIQRAEVNVRNISAKILGKRLKGEEEEEKAEQRKKKGEVAAKKDTILK